MKIEKINDYQIRCTLTKWDLAGRDMKVSELAYGTEKARALFREMMEEAGEKFGFVADDMPLMIEAIPWAADCLVLVITKADDPEELDTRFANFAPGVYYDDEEADEEEGFGLMPDEDAEMNFQSLFERMQEGGLNALAGDEYPSAQKLKQKVGSGKTEHFADDAEYRIFSFPMLKDVIRISRGVKPSYKGKNTLYRNDETGRCLLLLHRGAKEDPAFSQTCLMLAEYGREESASAASEQYLEEHCSIVLKDDALQQLKRSAGRGIG